MLESSAVILKTKVSLIGEGGNSHKVWGKEASNCQGEQEPVGARTG